jgi:hypothetical protein
MDGWLYGWSSLFFKVGILVLLEKLDQGELLEKQQFELEGSERWVQKKKKEEELHGKLQFELEESERWVQWEWN